MRVGFVSMWANRGQAIITRQLRQIMDDAGHETFILARPTGDKAAMPKHIDRRPEWEDRNVTYGSGYQMPPEEYVSWAHECDLDVVLTDQNSQFKQIKAIRRMGVRTVGRFVWERFNERQTERAMRAFDVVYSLTRAEQERYRSFGMETPLLRYGVHPSLIEHAGPKRDDAIYFILHGGALGPRKPFKDTIEAFKSVDAPNIRLVVKTQLAHERRTEEFDISDDPRIELIVGDSTLEEYIRLLSGCHVCLTPTRWEGLGVWIFEALAFGMPVITTDIPPVNEFVRDGVNGLLARPVPIGLHPNSEIAIFDTDVGHLRECIAELADPGRLAAMTATLLEDRPRLSWDHTIQDYTDLVEGRI